MKFILKNMSTHLVRSNIISQVSTESEVVVVPVEEGSVLPQLAPGHSDHLLGLLLLPRAFRGGWLGCSLAGRQFLSLDNLRGPHQLHHLLGLQLNLVRSDLNRENR